MDWFDPEYVAQRAAERAAKVAEEQKGEKFRKQVKGFVAAFFFKKAVAV